MDVPWSLEQWQDAYARVVPTLEPAAEEYVDDRWLSSLKVICRGIRDAIHFICQVPPEKLRDHRGNEYELACRWFYALRESLADHLGKRLAGGKWLGATEAVFKLAQIAQLCDSREMFESLACLLPKEPEPALKANLVAFLRGQCQGVV